MNAITRPPAPMPPDASAASRPASPVQSTGKLTTGSDVEIARHLRARAEQIFGQFVYAESKFWSYSGSEWQPIASHELRQVVHGYDSKAAGSKRRIRLSQGRINSILNELATMCADPDFFARATPGINCASGFIRFSDRGMPQLEPHSRDHRCRHTLPGHWISATLATLPRDSLLHRLLHGAFEGDPDAQAKIGLIAEICGAAALGHGTHLPEPKAVVLLGRKAGNGKSQILDLARALLPTSAITSISPAEMADEKHRIGLIGKLLNARDELSGARAITGEIFKAVITGEPVSARDVYQSRMDFRSRAQHIFATNELPMFSGGMDRGVRRRLLVIPFNRVIPPGERVEGIGQRIGTEEADLLLAFAVEGASRLIRCGAFTVPPSSKDALDDWINDDPIAAWLDDCVEARTIQAGQPAMRTRDAYEAFRSWALAEGHEARCLPEIKAFTGRVQAIAPAGIEYKRTAIGRFFLGMVLRERREASRPGHNLVLVQATA